MHVMASLLSHPQPHTQCGKSKSVMDRLLAIADEFVIIVCQFVMSCRPFAMRAHPLFPQKFTSRVFRCSLSRRFASNDTKLTGAMDNAFNRERLAVKQHAAQSAGRDFQHFSDRCANTSVQIYGGNSASSTYPFACSDRRELRDNSVVIPSIILAGLNAKNLWDEHWEHWEHMPPLEDRVQYPYMNIRTKAFPWGDGDKVRPTFWYLSFRFPC